MSLGAQNIRNQITKRIRETRIFFIIFFTVGILGITTGTTRDFFISLIPIALLLCLLAVIAFHQLHNIKKETILYTGIFLAGFIIEAVGVNTGRIFGNYGYGNGLGIKIFNTPVLIGINWFLLVYCTAVITENFKLPDIFKIPISSLLMVIYDVILEQVAPELDMWNFEFGFAPVRNYIAWFLLAIIFHGLLTLAGVKIVNRIAPSIFYIQALFFFILTIFFKLIP